MRTELATSAIADGRSTANPARSRAHIGDPLSSRLRNSRDRIDNKIRCDIDQLVVRGFRAGSREVVRSLDPDKRARWYVHRCVASRVESQTNRAPERRLRHRSLDVLPDRRLKKIDRPIEGGVLGTNIYMYI